MYTQCPECDVAFRITAEVLQQARGQVRCGSCGSAFNALDHLHEEPPVDGGESAAADAPAAATGRELLDTLDDLAGPGDVRIEDTGVEWLVLEDAAGDGPVEGSWEVSDDRDRSSRADADIDTAETSEQPALDEQTALEFGGTPAEEMRFDDNTPLPDDFGMDEDDVTPAEPPRRRATDVPSPVETDETQTELELSEPDDWKDLLDEVGESQAGNDPSAGGELPLEIEEELAAIHDELSALPESLIADAAVAVEEITREEKLLDVDAEPPTPEAAEADEEPEAITAEITAQEAVQETGTVEEPETEPVAEPVETAAARDEAVEGTEPDDAELTVDDVLQLEEQDIELRATGEAAADGDAEDLLDADDVEALAEDTGSNERPAIEAVDDAESDGAERLVEYEESTGEFEKAIQSAEDAIIAERAEQDAEADDAEVDREPDDAELSLAEDEGEGEDDIAAMTGSMQIDDELLRAMKDKDLAASLTDGEGSPVVETIVMEGDAVRGLLDIEKDADDEQEPPPIPRQPLKDPGSLVDTYMMSRADPDKRYWLGGRTMAALVVLLVLVLAGQYIHSSREQLATYALFNQTIAPLYRMFGQPVTPRWDIKGWQFEATSGSTDADDQILTISSRISNRSQQALPYPLVHVSLTDRYEEIIGSRILEPNEYLAGNADPSRPVAAGSNFTAVITIASPSPEATGFKLNVCYRVAAEQVRCAIEDFKAP